MRSGQGWWLTANTYLINTWSCPYAESPIITPTKAVQSTRTWRALAARWYQSSSWQTLTERSFVYLIFHSAIKSNREKAFCGCHHTLKICTRERAFSVVVPQQAMKFPLQGSLPGSNIACLKERCSYIGRPFSHFTSFACSSVSASVLAPDIIDLLSLKKINCYLDVVSSHLREIIAGYKFV